MEFLGRLEFPPAFFTHERGIFPQLMFFERGILPQLMVFEMPLIENFFDELGAALGTYESRVLFPYVSHAKVVRRECFLTLWTVQAMNFHCVIPELTLCREGFRAARAFEGFQAFVNVHMFFQFLGIPEFPTTFFAL